MSTVYDEGSLMKVVFRVVGLRFDGEEAVLGEHDFYEAAEVQCWNHKLKTIDEVRIDKVWVKKCIEF